eukprot:TRINITY_DN428_c1_g1_i2.p1 TRINITY_DN428_c1_g1~~TRINITY_DN428_c1_g1_i2.p1  ORF type:complete len:152 (+),score=29.98 TRINITY_DN428_c1_g1_i2:105-560(+)
MASKSLMMFFGWLASAVFNVILVICMYAASTVDGLAGEAKFHIVWFSFLIIGWQGASILVLKKFNTALAYGSLIGSTFAMSQFNLINGVVWAGLGSDLDSKSFKAAAAFAFIEFLGMVSQSSQYKKLHTWLFDVNQSLTLTRVSNLILCIV